MISSPLVVGDLLRTILVKHLDSETPEIHYDNVLNGFGLLPELLQPSYPGQGTAREAATTGRSRCGRVPLLLTFCAVDHVVDVAVDLRQEFHQLVGTCYVQRYEWRKVVCIM